MENTLTLIDAARAVSAVKACHDIEQSCLEHAQNANTLHGSPGGARRVRK